ncbi:MAG: 30S ribosomal protein S18 [Anaerolineae bacterium]|nr:30S ribosomal protein S18 [Anaerolineae bacterium]
MSDEELDDLEEEPRRRRPRRDDNGGGDSDRGGRGGRRRDDSDDDSGRGGRGGRGGRRFGRRAKISPLYSDPNFRLDYKDPETLRRFITDHGKIRPRRQTGLYARDQRRLAREVKRARHLALLPFTGAHVRET